MKEQKFKILALMGPSGSGKDKIRQFLLREYPNYTNSIISCTTRDKRDNEEDDIDYHFLDSKEMLKRIIDNKMIECTIFNDWVYGTSIDDLKSDKINIGIFSPLAIECLSKDNRIDLDVYYIFASDKTRMLRCLTREKNPNCAEICRRFLADEKDFLEFDYDFNVFVNEECEDIHKSKFMIENWLV